MNKAQEFLIMKGYNDVVVSRQNDALIYVSDVLMEFAQAGTQQADTPARQMPRGADDFTTIYLDDDCDHE